jgi:exopolyphosphatase/guanosine-5'-triphosphate,3'-diphosphate pyrophosphatase
MTACSLRERPEMSDLLAAVDCGTHSTRMLIGDGKRTVERLMRITRLGHDVDSTGRLAPEAIERVVAALVEFRQVLESYAVKKVRVTATSAARDAVNREDFFDAAEQVLGVRPELLSGIEEGHLSFSGATAELDATDGPFLILDIGGGSTEFVVGTKAAEAALSCDIGCVRLSERWIEHDPPQPEELLACLSVVGTHIDDVVREVPGALGAKTLVGLAGTVSTAAAVELGLSEYDRDEIHHFRISKAVAEEVFRTLATENRLERIQHPGMEEDRADVIVAGLSILVKVMRQLEFEECLVSESDILDGIVAELV